MIEKIPELRRLSASEKLTLVTELWEDLASQPDDIPITSAQIAEVDRRLEEYREGLGVTFLQELEVAYEYLQRHPRIGRLYAEDADGFLCRIFPLGFSIR